MSETLGGLVVLLLAGACSVSGAKDERPMGDPVRGREVFMSRDGGFCVLCHAVPDAPIAGDVGPSLAGVGSRLTPAELRERIADMSRFKPDAAMPSFHRTEGLQRVAPEHLGKPVLNEGQLDDVVAYLSSLK